MNADHFLNYTNNIYLNGPSLNAVNMQKNENKTKGYPISMVSRKNP